MSHAERGRFRTFGVHPTARGFGWVVCEGPFKLIEAGVCTALRSNKNADCLRHFERLVARLKPSEVVLEAFDRESSIRSERIRTLCLAFVAAAADRGLSVEAHKRDAVRRTFETVGAQTREEIAEAVARHFPELGYRLPKRRKRWDSEDRRLAIFNAVAVVLSHFHNGATALLEDLRNAA